MRGFFVSWSTIIFVALFLVEEGTTAPPVAKKACRVQAINVQKNFDLKRFQGHWYDFARVELARDAVVLSSGVSEYTLQPDGQLRIEYGGETNGRCIRPLVSLAQRQNSTNSAKLTVTFADMPDFFLRGAFWVIETNYDHAVIYACYKLRPDETCDPSEELAYIMSRKRTLPNNITQRVNNIVRTRLCIDLTRLKQTEYTFPCPPDPRYDPQKYLETILKENSLEVTTATDRFNVSFIGSQMTPVFDSSSAVSQLSTERSLINDEPVSFIDEPSNITASLSEEEQVSMASWTREEITRFTKEEINFISEESIQNYTPTFVSERLTDSLVTSPFHDEISTTAATLSKRCRVSDIPTLKGFELEKFLGQWFLIASYSSTSTYLNSATAVLSKSRGNVITTAFTGQIGNECLPTLRGYLRPTVEDPASLQANYPTMSGPFKVIFVSENYTSALVYQCNQSSLVDGVCQSVAIDVLSRARHLSTDDMKEAVRRSVDVCLEPSDFVTLKHEVDCEVEPFPESGPSCKMGNFQVQQDIDWSRFAGKWYTVSRLRRRFGFESGTWVVSERINGTISASYVAVRHDNCLPPVRTVWTPAIDRSGSFLVTYDGVARLGKIVYTDYQVALYYECQQMESDGICRESNVRMEVWQRNTDAMGNILLMFGQRIRDLCINPQRLQIVSHDVRCDVPPQCSVPEAVLPRDDTRDKLLGRWKPWFLLKSEEATGSKQQLNEIMFSAVSSNRTIVVCLTTTSHQNVCQSTECVTFRSLFTSDYQRFTMDDGRNGYATRWRLVYVDDLHLVVYICHKVDGRGRGRACDHTGGRLYVLGRPDGPVPGDDLPHRLQPTLDKMCLNWEKKMNITVSCPVEVPPYSKVIDTLPVFESVNLPQFMGIWYSIQVAGYQTVSKVSKLRLSLEASGKVDIVFANSINGTCQPSKRYLATKADDRGADWLILTFDRQSGHLRVLYTDPDIAVVYFCQRLKSRGICFPNESLVLLMSKAPALTEERRGTIRENLRAHQYDSIEDVIEKAGFRNDLGSNVSFAEAVACSVQTDENLCPIESLPVLKKLHFNKFLGSWFVVSRLRNSPSFDTAELRLSPGEETSILYTGTKNGKCQRPLRGKLVPLPDGLDSQFEVNYGNGHIGRYQVIFTNYRSALVYQCLQLLSDGACLPGLVVVELLSRTNDINPRLKVPLLKRTKDLCVNPDDMEDTTYNGQCGEEAYSSCYIDDFPKDVTLTNADLLGYWYVSHVAKRIRGFKIPSSVRILSDSDPNRFRYIAQFTRDGSCYSIESHLLVLSSEAPYHMVFDFKENNALLRVIEAGYGMMLAYVCKYVESDGRCRPDYGGVLVLSRSLDDVPEELLVHYTDLFPDLCLNLTDELIRVSPSDCKVVESVQTKSDCDIKSADIRPQFAYQMVDVEWHLAGWMGSNVLRPSVVKYHISRHSKSGHLSVHFTAAKEGKCLPTTQVLATLTREGSYEILYNDRHAEFFIIFADAEVSIIYSCQSYDSFGRCDPQKISVELFTRNESLPDLAKAKLYEIELNWCFTPENFIPTHKGGIDCPLLIEPECTIDSPPLRSTIDLDKVGGYWYALATQSGRNLPRISNVDIEMSEDQQKMTAFISSSQNGRCLPTFKTTMVNSSPNNFRWKFQSIGLTGYLLLVYVDDDYLVLLECISNEVCTPDSVSSVDLYARKRSPLDEVDRRKLAKVFRRICHDIDNFTFLLSDVECVVEERPSLSLCNLEEHRGRPAYVVMPQVTGTWYAGAKLKRSEVAESEVMRITGHELTSIPSYTAIYTGSRRGQCLSSVRGQLLPQNDGNEGLIKIAYEDSSTVEWVILFTDYRYLVTMECRDLGVNDSCRADNAIIAMYTREPVDISSIIAELIRVVGLDECLRAHDFISISHEVPCSIVTPHCVLLPNLPLRDNFTMDDILGVWHSLYHLRSLTALDSYTIRFHRDDSSGMIVGYFTGSHNRDCQPAVSFVVPNNSREWTTSIGDKQARMKVLAIDRSHIILYKCLGYDANQGVCRADATHVHVLSHNKAENPSPSIATWAANAVHQACIEFGDMDHTHHAINCPLPVIKKTRCPLDKMPVAALVDYNKLGGVWYSYLLLKGSAVDFSTTILQWSGGTSYSAIFRSSRKDECLSVQTGAVVPRTVVEVFKADFDAKFRTYSARFRVLYTDYSYALIYTCTSDLEDGQCPPVHRQVTIYGRLKTGRMPPAVREKIFAIANEACLYEEDFVEAIHYAECDLPYSGRHSCRVDDVITHDAFDVREMFGIWQLLSRTTNLNSTLVAESIRFSPGVGGIIKYIISGEDSLGLCKSVDGTIESVVEKNATFTFTENGGETHLMKVLYMHAQYLVFYICHGPLPADLEVCDESREEVKIYGRTSVMSLTVRKTLTDIIWSRICLNLSFMIDVKHNNKCDLPSGCDIQDFILEENFDPHMVTGTWQVLVRSSFRQSSALPSTAKFFQTLTGAINMVRVINQTDSYCHTENLLLRPTDGAAGIYQTQLDLGTASSTTLFLYVIDRYFVTLDCIGELSSEGECTAEKVELTIWGRTWDLSSSLRQTLLQEIRDRTLRCYAIHTMVDVELNENCELPSSACDNSHYVLEKDFDGRLMLGQWHLLARSPLYRSHLRIGDMRIALSGQTYHIDIAGKHNDGDCFETSASMKFVPGMNSTLVLASDNVQTLTQIVYWSEEYLIRVDCIGISSPVTYCHPERTGLQLLSRTGYMDEDTMSHLIRVTRERTQSCVATSRLEAVPFAENICPNSAPLEGSEACGFNSIQLDQPLDLQKLNGIWFQVMRSNRVREFHWDGGIYHFNIKDNSVTLIYAGRPSFRKNGHCFVESTEAEISSKDNTEWHTVMHGHNDTMKIIYLGDDHLITYECFDNQFTSHRHCRPEFEHLEVFHRRRQVNARDLRQLLSIVSQQTCFSKAELIHANHSRKCEIPGILDLDYSKGKPCDVETYLTVSEFEPQRFVGIWHEVERTRYSHGVLWESGIFNFSLDASGSLGFLYSGTKGGQCLGPIEGHSRPVQGALGSSDLFVWIGPKQESHHPWIVHYRFKIVHTDYENTALIYSCHSTTDDGICHRTSELVFVLSRSRDVDAVVRERVYSAIHDALCLDVYDLVKTADEANCQDFVNGSHAEITRLVRERHILQRHPKVEPDEPSTAISQTTRHGQITSAIYSTAVLECIPVLCAKPCPNGSIKDRNGCETCMCELTEALTTSSTTDIDIVESQITYPPTNLEKEYESTIDPVECAIPMCANFCEFGYARDRRGCETCNCSPAPTEPPGENDFDFDNSVTAQGEVTSVPTGDKISTEAHGTGLPIHTPSQGTPIVARSIPEVEGMVEEIYLPDVHPVFPERKTRTADKVGPDGNQFHLLNGESHAEQGSNQLNVESTNKTDELSTDNSTEPNATEPVRKNKSESVDPDSNESKNEEQDKAESKKEEQDKAESKNEEHDKAESKKEEQDKAESKKEEQDKAESKKEEHDKAESKKEEHDKANVESLEPDDNKPINKSPIGTSNRVTEPNVSELKTTERERQGEEKGKAWTIF